MEVVISDRGEKRLKLNPDEWSTASVALSLGSLEMVQSRKYRDLFYEVYSDIDEPLQDRIDAAVDVNGDHTVAQQLRGVRALTAALSRASQMWKSQHGVPKLLPSTDDDPFGQKDRFTIDAQVTVNPDEITDASLELVHAQVVEIGGVASEACIRGLKALINKKRYEKITGVPPVALGDYKTYSEVQAWQMLDQT
jgi:hypothetical protein